MSKEIEFVNLTQFAFRLSVPVTKVRKALEQNKIVAASRSQGHTLIQWPGQYRKFMKWCGEATLQPKKLWSGGKMLDPDSFSGYNIEDKDEKNTEDDSPVITEDTSLEELEKFLLSNISTDEAKRIRQILGARKEILALKELNGDLLNVNELIPKLIDISVLIRKGLMAIRPRVAAQFAAMDDQFAIGKLLDKEIISVLDQLPKALEKLKQGGSKNGK